MDYLVERTGGEIVRDSLRIYRDYFGPIVLIYALPVLPVLLISAYVNLSLGPVAAQGVGVLDLLVSAFPYGAVTIAVADICIGNSPTVRSSYGAIYQNFWRYIGTYLLSIAIFVGGVTLSLGAGWALQSVHPLLGVFAGLVVFVAALSLTFRYMFACQVCMIERRGPIQSLRRSRHLIRGMFWRTVGLSLALLFLVYLVLLSAAMVFGFLVGVLADEGHFDLVVDLVGRILTILGTPVLLIGFVLLYYDLRVRKENYDSNALTLELMS